MRKESKQLAWILFASALLVTGCKAKPAPPAVQKAPVAAVPQVGGENVVMLERKATSGGAKPEFLSVTLFPGRGMNMFQITANIPGKGVIRLLHSPSIEQAASEMTGTGRDRFGGVSYSFGGAFLVPYPNRVTGKLSSDGQSITTSWRGHTLSLPANAGGGDPKSPKVAMHGLIVKSKAEDLQTQTTSDGQTETAVIHAGDFGGHWLSDTDLNFTVALTGDAVETTITAKNVGKEVEPMAIGWHPYFVIPSGDRSQVRLHVPASMMAVVNNYTDVIPTGRLKPVKGTPYDYQAADGVPIDDRYLDDSFTHLQRTDGAVDVRVTDPKSNYGIRVQALSPEIRAVQIYSPKNAPFVAVEEQFNYADPFGKQWRGMDTGMVTLRPGQSVTWKVRLALFQPQQSTK